MEGKRSPPPASRLKIFKAFLLKAVLNVKDTKELARIDPDQPPPPSPITIQGAHTAEANMAELPVECEWGCKRDSQGKKKQWKGSICF